MKPNLRSPEFTSLLGNLVLDFGFMEGCIRTVLLVVGRDRALVKALVPSTNTVTSNLTLLHQLCVHKIKPTALEDWEDAIDDTRDLFEKRNTIFHGMLFEEEVEEETQLFIGKIGKSKHGSPGQFQQNKFDQAILIDIKERLENRRRQFMDFVTDYSNNEKGVDPAIPPSQHAFPSLSFGITV